MPHHLENPLGCLVALEHKVRGDPLVNMSLVQTGVCSEFARLQARVDELEEAYVVFNTEILRLKRQLHTLLSQK